MSLFGKAGEKNTVAVTFKLYGGAMQAQTIYGKTTITVDSAYFNQTLRQGNYLQLAENAAHEGDHGVMQQNDPRLALTSSRADLKRMEVSAYHSQSYVSFFLGVKSPYLGWTPLNGWNRAQIEQNANDSVDEACRSGGCEP